MIGEYNIQTRNRTHLLTSKQPPVMGGTKGHHKRSDGNTSVRRELPSRRWDIRQGCTPLPYRSIPEIEHGTSHFEDGTCTWVRRVLHTPLAQRWAAHGELSLLLHGGRGGESWSSLPFFPKMRCGGQSWQNGCPFPKWMVGEQNCPQIHFLERADGGGTTSTPFWQREQGTLSPGRYSGRCPGPFNGE